MAASIINIAVADDSIKQGENGQERGIGENLNVSRGGRSRQKFGWEDGFPSVNVSGGATGGRKIGF